MTHTLLLVSDDLAWQTSTRRGLEGQGYAVESVPGGADGLSVVRGRMPHAVVHHRREDNRGGPFVRLLRAMPGGADVPIVAVWEGEAEPPGELGYTAAVRKTVDPLGLGKVLQRLLAQLERDPIGRGRHIVLVDDSPLQRKLVRHSLTHWGFRVEEASSAREALSLAVCSPPAAIVSDFLMPGGDGLTLCTLAKRTRCLAQVPFIVVSSILFSDQRLDSAREFGADAFVSSEPEHRALARALVALLDAR